MKAIIIIAFGALIITSVVCEKPKPETPAVDHNLGSIYKLTKADAG